MWTKDLVINKLRQIMSNEVGYIEKRSGDQKYLYDKTANKGSNNYTKYGYRMHQIQPSNMDYPAAWCDAYVDDSFVQAFGIELAKQVLHDFDDYTVRSADLYKQHGEWYISNPLAGDQIFFNDSHGEISHTGWIDNVVNNKIITFEGNTSNGSTVNANGGMVCQKTYNINYSRIAGFGRPNYQIIVDTYNKAEEQIEIDELYKRANTLSNTMIYNYYDNNIPEYYREALKWEMDHGIIKGDENGLLNLTENDLRQITREYRFFKLIQSKI